MFQFVPKVGEKSLLLLSIVLVLLVLFGGCGIRISPSLVTTSHMTPIAIPGYKLLSPCYLVPMHSLRAVYVYPDTQGQQEFVFVNCIISPLSTYRIAGKVGGSNIWRIRYFCCLAEFNLVVAQSETPYVWARFIFGGI